MERSDRYSIVAIGLHWLIAGFILFNLAFGFFMEGMPRDLRGVILPLHASSGFTVLILTLVRIAWRLAHRPPAFLPAPGWQHIVAHLVHVSLYGLMLGLPLTGMAIMSAHPAGPLPVPPPGGGPAMGLPKVWGLFDLPVFLPLQTLAPAAQKATHDAMVFSHSVLGWTMLGLLVLHVAAALKHQLIDGQPQFRRMGIG